jgi:hypothetical protein
MLVSGYKVSVRWEKQIVGFYYTAQWLSLIIIFYFKIAKIEDFKCSHHKEITNIGSDETANKPGLIVLHTYMYENISF